MQDVVFATLLVIEDELTAMLAPPGQLAWGGLGP